MQVARCDDGEDACGVVFEARGEEGGGKVLGLGLVWFGFGRRGVVGVVLGRGDGLGELGWTYRGWLFSLRILRGSRRGLVVVANVVVDAAAVAVAVVVAVEFVAL